MSSRNVQIGRIGVWSGALDAFPAGEAVEMAQELEALGYGALWIPEAVGRDPFVFASILLSGTERLPIATGIASIFARDAMTTANAQRTLHEAYPNRFLLGLGVSHHNLVEWVRKHDYDKPLTRMREYLTFMQEKGIYRAVGGGELPTTVIAALGPKMLALAADRADGAHPYFTTPAHTAQAREIMGPDALLAPEQMVVLSTDADEARTIARQTMPTYTSLPNYANNLRREGFTDDDLADPLSDSIVDAIVAWGTVEQVASRVREHLDAGADHVCVQVLTADPRDGLVDGWRELAPALVD